MWYTYEIYAYDADGKRVSYYGHTYDINLRRDLHRSSYFWWIKEKRPKKLGHACTSVFVLDMEGWIMKELDNFETEQDAIDAEKKLIKNNLCVNKVIPARSYSEWYADNRDKKLQQVKDYSATRRAEKNEYAKQYRKKNKEKIKAKRQAKRDSERMAASTSSVSS